MLDTCVQWACYTCPCALVDCCWVSSVVGIVGRRSWDRTVAARWVTMLLLLPLSFVGRSPLQPSELVCPVRPVVCAADALDAAFVGIFPRVLRLSFRLSYSSSMAIVTSSSVIGRSCSSATCTIVVQESSCAYRTCRQGVFIRRHSLGTFSRPTCKAIEGTLDIFMSELLRACRAHNMYKIG